MTVQLLLFFCVFVGSGTLAGASDEWGIIKTQMEAIRNEVKANGDDLLGATYMLGRSAGSLYIVDQFNGNNYEILEFSTNQSTGTITADIFFRTGSFEKEKPFLLTIAELTKNSKSRTGYKMDFIDNGQSTKPSMMDPAVLKAVQDHFAAIHKVLKTVGHERLESEHLLHRTPTITIPLPQFLAEDNIDSYFAMKDVANDLIQGIVYFKTGSPFPPGKMDALFRMYKDNESKTGYTMSLEDTHIRTRSKRQTYPDPDCEWWGCIDG